MSARPPHKNIFPEICNERGDGYEEENSEEGEDNEAPHSPEMEVAVLEEVKLEFINDNEYASVLPEINAVSFKGHGYKEEAPVPSEQIAALFNGQGYKEEKREEVENNESSPPPAMEAGHDHEENKREEGEDNEATRPPSMMAASFEEHGYAEQEK